MTGTLSSAEFKLLLQQQHLLWHKIEFGNGGVCAICDQTAKRLVEFAFAPHGEWEKGKGVCFETLHRWVCIPCWNAAGARHIKEKTYEELEQEIADMKGELT